MHNNSGAELAYKLLCFIFVKVGRYLVVAVVGAGPFDEVTAGVGTCDNINGIADHE